MPREHLVSSLQSANPNGFVAIPKAQLLLKFLKKRFPNAKKNVTVGPTFGLLPRPTLEDLKQADPTQLRVPQ